MLAGRFLDTATVLAVVGALAPAPAQDQQPVFDFNLGEAELDDALVAIGRLTGRQIMVASDAVAGLRSRPVSGRYSADDAIRLLLEGTALEAEFTPRLVIVRPARSSRTPEDRAGASDIVVTGSRIRGARQAAPMVVTTREQIVAAGQTDLGEVARSLPQNFTGGQNPGVGQGAENFGSENVNSATTLDLRGLGADATLTLLNGRRLAYNAVSEGVDISAIPASAVARLEVVADGASALYGSDAVAGVANIILRRDLNGAEARARLAAATDGGFVQDQYEASMGRTWSSGGVIGSVTFNRNTSVRAGQRSFARTIDPGSTLYPSVRHVGGVVSGRQMVSPALELGVDGLFSHRRSFTATANLPTASVSENGTTRAPITRTFYVSPVAELTAGSWLLTASATYGRDVTLLDTRYLRGGLETNRFTGRYRNRSQSAELSGEGPLLTLPGGAVRLAAGAGYRSIGLAANQRADGAVSFDIRQTRDSYHAFGELNVPLVAESNSRPGIDRLALNLAGRFEHYPSVGDVFTPKLSAIFSPVDGLDIRGSWGRSFKAPTLYQQYQAQFALLLPARFLGGDPDDATATALFLAGGNRDVTPQTATNWSVGTALRPRAFGDLVLEATYFQTRYRDRIVTPIVAAGRALVDPTIADLITLSPTAAVVAATVAASDGGVVNLTGRPLDPATVAAIVDNRNLNVAEQKVRGVDLLGNWTFNLKGGAKLVLTANGTWLDSRRRLSSGQPLVELAGTVFNPPDFRGRAGASLSAGAVSAAAFVSRTGGLQDRRFGDVDQVAGQTTVDLTLGYRAERGPLQGASVQLAALNLFNSKPDLLRTANIFETPYDSTNFSPIGRLVAIAVGTTW